MKRVLFLLFALLLIVALPVSAAAEWSVLNNIPMPSNTEPVETPSVTNTPAASETTGGETSVDLSAGSGFVMDLADILTDEQERTLAAAARSATERTGCGIYIGTINDMKDYGFYFIEQCAETFYSSFELGVGEEHTGLLLLLSMAERDYDIDAYGSFAHISFTDYGKEQLATVFLDNFRQNDWYGGFSDYISQAEYMLDLSAQGDPVDVPVPSRITGIGSAISAVFGAIGAAIVCAIMKSGMKNVHTAVNADEYIPAGGVKFRVRDDRFTHRTQVRQHIERSSGGSSHSGGHSGGTTISSSGHSHSSGKF